MTYIPDARTEKIEVLGKVEDNPYYQENLTKEDRDFIRGYDFAVSGVLETIFDSIGDFDFSVEGEDIELGRFLINHPEIRQKAKETFKEQFELSRNEIITSMIDGYEEKEE